uniref:Uncharacterized protein n=1 Tax=Arundo donax TaxID=35708 RepID=A0A0A9GYE8_ARUDO
MISLLLDSIFVSPFLGIGAGAGLRFKVWVFKI